MAEDNILTVRIESCVTKAASKTKRIHLRAIAALGCGKNDKHHNFAVDLPLALEEDQLRWLLESHIEDPFSINRAIKARDYLQRQAVNLRDKMKLKAIIEKLEDEEGHNVKEIQVNIVLDRPGISAEPGGSEINLLRWESLEDPSLLFQRPVTVRRIVETDAETPPTPSPDRASFRILLVVSRDPDADGGDIDHQLVSSVLYQQLRSMGSQAIDLDILRPGTFETLESALEATTYNLVHFDVHGDVSVVSTSQGAELYFAGQAVAASNVAELLRAAKVEAVILNACRSATASAITGSSSDLARTFIEAGVHFVIGMAYKVTTDAVTILLTHFYRFFLIDREPVHRALYKARRYLQRDSLRTATFDLKVDISDYIVPVLYQRSTCNYRVNLPDSPNSVDVLVPQTLPPLLGRSQDLFKIEHRLLTSKIKVGVIHGFPGTGKATLMAYVKRWWHISKLFPHIITFDFGSLTAKDIEAGDEAWSSILGRQLHDQIFQRPGSNLQSDDDPLAKSVEYLLHNRCLLILENINQVSEGSQERQVRLLNILSPFLDKSSSTFVLITSCNEENWIKVKISGGRYRIVFRHMLRGISPFFATQFVQSLLSTDQRDARKWSAQDYRYLERILRVLDYSPTALSTVVPALLTGGIPLDQSYRRLMAGRVQLDWDSDKLLRCRQQFSKALDGSQDMTYTLVSLQSVVSLTLLADLVRFNMSIADAAGSKDNPINCKTATETLVDRLIIYGIANPLPSKDYKIALSLHPLLSQYARHLLTEASVMRALDVSSAVLHNGLLVATESPSPPSEVTLRFLQHNWDVLMACLHHCTNGGNISFMAARSFDIPWLYCTLLVQQRRTVPGSVDARELLTDLAFGALRRILPDYWPTANLAWLKFQTVYLYKAGIALSGTECLFASQLLLWIASYFFDMCPQLSRLVTCALLQLLEHVKFDASDGTQDMLKKFIKGIAILTLLELDYEKNFWVPGALNSIWFAVQDPQLRLDQGQKRFLQIWEQDFRYRINGFERVSAHLLDNSDQLRSDKLVFTNAPRQDYVDALKVDKFINKGISHDMDMDTLQSILLGFLSTATSAKDFTRARDLMDGLLEIHCRSGNWKDALTIVDQIEAYEKDMIQRARREDVDVAMEDISLKICELRCLCYMKLRDKESYVMQAGHAATLREEVECDYDNAWKSALRHKHQHYLNVREEVARQSQGVGVGQDAEYMAPVVETAFLSPEDILIAKPGQITEFTALGQGQFSYKRPMNLPYANNKAVSQRFIEAGRWMATTSYVAAIVGRSTEQDVAVPEFRRAELPLDLWFMIDHINIMTACGVPSDIVAKWAVSRRRAALAGDGNGSSV